MASRRSKILKRTIVGGSLAGVIGIFMWLAYGSEGGLVVWVGGAVVTLGCVYEVARMQRIMTRGLRLGMLAGMLGGLAPGFFHYFVEGWSAPTGMYDSYLSSGGILTAYLLGAAGMTCAFDEFLHGRRGLALLFALWLFAPMTSVTLIWSDYGADGLLALLILSKIGDIFGYYVGSAIGKSHPFPKISPGKTTAGCVASLVTGTLTGGLCVHFGLLPSASMGIMGGFVAGAVLNIAAQAGDLLESRVKRMAQVKDSGTWFGPSGGMLDLADSLLLSVPAALLIFPLLFA